jgi:hypothetical protein
MIKEERFSFGISPIGTFQKPMICLWAANILVCPRIHVAHEDVHYAQNDRRMRKMLIFYIDLVLKTSFMGASERVSVHSCIDLSVGCEGNHEPFCQEHQRMRKATRKKPVRKAAARRTTRKAAPRKAAKRKTGRPGVKAWSAAELSMLKKSYKSTTATAIAKRLRRSLSSVKAKIRVLGLSKPKAARKAAPKRKAAAKRRPAKRKAAAKKKPARRKR